MIKKISLLFVGCVVAFKIIGAVEGEMITRRANTRMLIDVKHPIRSGELKQALFINQKPQLDGTIYDERPGTGTPRPIQPGRAYLFDGVNDYIDIPNVPTIATGAAACWIKPNGGSSNQFGIAVKDPNRLYLGLSASNEIYVTTGSTNFTNTGSTEADWVHIGVRWDATNHYIYRNGVLIHSGAYSGSIGNTVSYLGAYSAGNNALKGSLAGVKIYSGSVNEADMLAIYEAETVTANLVGHWKCDDTSTATAYDSSGNGNHGTKTNITPSTFHYEGNDVPYSWQNQVGFTDDVTNGLTPRNESTPANDVLGNTLQYSGQVPRNAKLVESACATFDGVDDYVDIGDLGITGDWSVSVRLRVHTTAAIVQYAIGMTSNRGLFVEFGAFSDVWGMYDGSTQLTGNNLTENQWYTLTATKSGTTYTLYQDGLEVNSGTLADIDLNDFDIGRRPDAFWYFDGNICDVRVYNDALTSDEINYIYTHGDQGTDPTTTNLVAHYPLSEGAGTTIYDVSGNDNHGTATNITESTFWGTTQDVYHYNIANGFSLYEHASSDDLYVPYGANGIPLTITTPSGYTKTYDAPSGPWHNGAESKIDFTGGVASPGTSSWETAWIGGTARTNPLFARTNGNKHDHLLAYGSVKSGAELDAIDRYTQTIVPVESMIARAGMNINDGFYHWTSGIPTNNLAKHLSWPFAGAIDPNTLDRDLNWTFSGTVLFGLTLREGHPSGDYVITYTGPAGAVEFIGTNASVDGLTWTKSSPIEEFHVQVNASIDMTTLNIRHNSWPANETWNQQFKDYVGRFGIIRFLDWSKTNRATNTVPWQQASGDHFEWADRPLPGQWSYFSNSSAAGADGLSVPVEAMVDLANEINADPWFPIHVKASDAYVLALAQYVDANLEPGLLARFERSNEVWNGQFPQKAYTLSLYDGTSVTNAFNDDAKTKYMHHKLSQAWGGIIKGVNANTNRFKMVLGIQHEAGLEYGVFDELGTTNLDEFASAPYVGGSLPGNQVDIDHPELDNILGIGTDPNQGLDYIFNVWIPNSRTNVNSFTSAKVSQIAVEHSIDYLTYEGGQHLSHSNDTVLSVLVAANRDPRMHQVYLDIISDWDTITGNAPYVFFSSTRSYIDTDTTPIFPFGHKEYEGQALSTTHKLRAIFEHFATSP